MGRWSGCGQLLKQHAFSPSFSSEISIVDTHTCILSSFKVRSRHDPTQSEMDGRRQWKYFFWVYTLARSERKTKTQWEYLTQSRWVTNLVVLRWYLWTPTKRAVTALPASTHIHLRGELYHSPKGKGEVAIKNGKRRVKETQYQQGPQMPVEKTVQPKSCHSLAVQFTHFLSHSVSLNVRTLLLPTNVRVRVYTLSTLEYPISVVC